MKNSETIVVKIGTSSLTAAEGRINLKRIEELAKVLSGIRNEGRQVVLVTSGAIGVGNALLGSAGRPNELDRLQAAAAVGQIRLMHIYDKLFSEFGTVVAQVLLTRNFVDNPVQRRNCVNTFRRLLSMGVIPIVNANDVITTDEIESGDAGFGDNDSLSAVVAELIGADLLVMMTDADGLFDADPHEHHDANMIKRVDCVTPKLYADCGGRSALGTGGMTAKLHAAERMLELGIDTVIMNGADPSRLYSLLDGDEVGTLFTRSAK